MNIDTSSLPQNYLQQYGPWALVTGASSGIGEQFCRILASLGFNVVLAARQESLLAQLANDIEALYKVQTATCVVDLSSEEQLKDFLESLKQWDLGLLVCNAGFGYKGKFSDMPRQELEAMCYVNSTAPMLIAHEMAPVLQKRGKAGIIFTGSMEGEVAFPWSSAYAASKALIHNLGLGLWQEYQEEGLDVLVLAPGSTDTAAPLKQGISRDQLVGVMSPQQVALEALQYLGKKPFHLCGLHNRIFINLLRILPKKWAAKMAGFGMKRAIEKSTL